MIKWEFELQGEGLQQKLPQKLATGFYNLDFDYLLPCDTMTYNLEIYFGTDINRCTYLAASIPLPTTNIGQWQNWSRRIIIPNSFDDELEWFLILNTSPYGYTGVGSFVPYIYVDDFHLTKLPCTDCDPHGLISWNNQSMRPYMTPDNDNVFDKWCMSNINNVSWYELWVIARWGPVYYETNSDANGYENYNLCWDGRQQDGQMLPFDTYQIIVRLGNCGSQITRAYQVVITNDLAMNAYSVAQNYVPPLFGLEPSPTHYRELHLYGGPYYGTHDWYACDSIIVADDGAPRVPYFWAASSSNLGFHFGSGFDTHAATDFRIDPGADIDIVPENVQCCPQFRLADPNLVDTKIDEFKAMTEAEEPMDAMEDEAKFMDQPLENESDEFSMHVYPIPANDFLKIDFHLPSRDEVRATMTNTNGSVISEILRSERLEAGDHSYSVSVKSIPDGMYFLLLNRSTGFTTVKVIVQR